MDNGNNLHEDEELLEQYIAWTKSATEDLRAHTDAYEASPNKAELANQIYDIAHNIKGMGGSFDYGLMTKIGTSLCHYLKKTEPERAASFKVINAHVRAIEVVIQNQIRGDGGDEGAFLLTRLENIVDDQAL